MYDRTTPHYSAVFDDGHGHVSHRAFETKDEAREFGENTQTEHMRFVEVQRRMATQALFAHVHMLAAQKMDLLEEGGNHQGVIVRWEPHDSWGFIVDTTGKQWFVHSGQITPKVGLLDVGTHIVFSGSPHPGPGKKWPQAYSVRVVDTEPEDTEPEPEERDDLLVALTPEPTPEAHPAEPQGQPDLLERIASSMHELANLLDAARVTPGPLLQLGETAGKALRNTVMDAMTANTVNGAAAMPVQFPPPPPLAKQVLQAVPQRPVPGPPRKDTP